MATASDIEYVRRRIGDSKKSFIDQFIGDGELTLFTTSYKNIFDVIVRLDGGIITPTVLSDSGQIRLAQPLDSSSTLDVEYRFAGFTDEQLNALIDTHNPDGAVVECLEELVANAARLHDYTQGQTKDSKSQVFNHLQTLLAQAKQSQGAYGGGNSLSVGDRSHSLYRSDSVQDSLYGDISRSDDFGFRWPR